MPAELPRDDDYASEEDSDFAPDDNAAGRNSSTSSDEEEGSSDDENNNTANNKNAKRKFQGGAGDAAAVDFDNSGDEAIIEKGKKKKKKRKLNKGAGKDGEDDDDAAAGNEEGTGGAGGLIKTRSMRAAEKAERKSTAARGPVTIDVDALWAELTSGTTKKPAPTSASATAQLKQDDDAQHAPDAVSAPQTAAADSGAAEAAASMVRIKRVYNFAGKVHTEEKLVARDSAEAKLYFASIGDGSGDGRKEGEDDDAPPKRMPRKAFRSRFEPVPDGGVGGALAPRRTDLDLGLSSARQRAEASVAAAAKKLNTVEKSRLDWAGFVDREGIQDELALAGRSKDSFAARQDFLARSEARREEDAWRVRMAGRA